MEHYILTATVILITLAIYIWMTVRIGSARAKHSISAPVMSGNEDFERVIRVHANTMEQLWLFLPLLVLFAMLWGDAWAALVGVFFPLGRIIYALGYYAATDKRGRGFLITFLTNVGLFIGVLVGIVLELWNTYL